MDSELELLYYNIKSPIASKTKADRKCDFN